MVIKLIRKCKSLPTTATANQIRADSHTATGASVDVNSLVAIGFMRTDG